MFNTLYLSNKGFDGDRYELLEIAHKIKHVFVTYTLYSNTFCLHSPIEASRNLTLTLSWAWWGRCEKNYLPKEEGREGGEKKRAQRARGSNPGPAAC